MAYMILLAACMDDSLVGVNGATIPVKPMSYQIGLPGLDFTDDWH